MNANGIEMNLGIHPHVLALHNNEILVFKITHISPTKTTSDLNFSAA